MRTEAPAGMIYQVDVSPGGRPEARRRGLQRALISARAIVAREVGCDPASR